MFIFENYFKNRDRKISEWKRAGKAWVEEKNGADGYHGYHDMNDYRCYHPYPVRKIRYDDFWTTFIIIFGIAAVIGTCVVVFVPDDHKPSSKSSSTSQTHKKCTEDKGIKVGDHVQIKYGDYADKQGKVLTCDYNENYRVRLDNGQKMTWSDDSGSHSRTLPNGQEITVDDNSNLYVIQ